MNKRMIAASLTMVIGLGLTASQCCSSAFAGEKEPTEIVSLRSEYGKHFDNGDGTYSAYINTVPIHYFDGNEWIEIDNSLISDGNGNYTNSSSDLNVTLPSVISENDNEINLVYKGSTLGISLDTDNNSSEAIITQPKQNGSAYNESGHGYQDYVSCNNLFNGFGQYATIIDAEFMMYMDFNYITTPKQCEVYSLNSQPINCSWSNGSLNNYNTKISDFTTSTSDTYLWVNVDFTKLAQSWKNYADSSYAAGVPAYGFKIVTYSSPEATVSAMSERATSNHPYYDITYSISSTYTLDYAPYKYDNIIDSSHGNINNFQNRMNCYAYALQMYNRGGYKKLNPGYIGLTYNPSASTCSQLNSLYSSQTSLSNFQTFTKQQMFYDALKLGVNITSITLSNNNQFILPSSYDESSERIIAMNCGGKYNPYSPDPEGYDFHFYVRHGNGTCGNPNHDSTCSKWSHKMALNTVSDNINGALICDNNIATLAKSAYKIENTVSGITTTHYNSTPKFYFIQQNTNLYNSWYTYVSSSDTVTFTN